MVEANCLETPQVFGGWPQFCVMFDVLLGDIAWYRGEGVTWAFQSSSGILPDGGGLTWCSGVPLRIRIRGFRPTLNNPLYLESLVSGL